MTAMPLLHVWTKLAQKVGIVVHTIPCGKTFDSISPPSVFITLLDPLKASQPGEGFLLISSSMPCTLQPLCGLAVTIYLLFSSTEQPSRKKDPCDISPLANNVYGGIHPLPPFLVSFNFQEKCYLSMQGLFPQTFSCIFKQGQEIVGFHMAFSQLPSFFLTLLHISNPSSCPV